MVRALEQQYDAFERAEESGDSLLAGDEPLPTGEEIGQQFEQFLAGLDGPSDGTTPELSRPPVSDTRGRGPRCTCSTSRRSTRTSSAGASRHRPGPGLRRAGGRAGAGGRRPHRGRRSSSPHSLPLLLPAARRLRRADHLRRRAAPRRPLVPDPPGHARQHGRPIYYQTVNFQKPEDGLDHQDVMPDVIPARGGAGPGRPDARTRQRGRRRARQGVGLARGALPRQLPARTAPRPAATRRGPGCGSGSRRGSATTRWPTWRRSPTPAT